MAKGRPARRTAKSGQSAAPTAAALLCLVALVAGGAYLFEHTRSLPGSHGPSPQDTVVPLPAPMQPPASQPDRQPGHPSGTSRPSPEPTQPLQPGASAHPATSPARAAPFGSSEEVFEAGAHAYAQQRCGGCHGRPGKEVARASAEQFWSRKDTPGHPVRGLSAGGIYQAIATGNPAGGMPSYGPQLSDTALWDLALLLKSSGEDLPDPVLRILRTGN